MMRRWLPLLALLGLALSIWSVEAAPPPRQDTLIPQSQVGVYAIGIRNFDAASGSYTMDLYLTLRCANNEPCDPTNFEITNGGAESLILQNDTPILRVYRIEAALHSAMDFHRYPFDQQELTFEIEDQLLDDTQFIYLPDTESTNVDPSLMIPGWDVVNSSGEVQGHYYSAWDETYSHYRFTVTVRRPITSSILKFVLPTLLILVVGFFSLYSPHRLILLIAILIIAVLFHLNILASLPPINYLTLADWVMLTIYAALLFAIILTIVVQRHPHSRRRLESGIKTITDTLFR